MGHVKGVSAGFLAPVLDSGEVNGDGGNGGGVVAVEGTIPRGGNGFALPLALEYYAVVGGEADVDGDNEDDGENAARKVSRAMVEGLRQRLQTDTNFRLVPEFAGAAVVGTETLD